MAIHGPSTEGTYGAACPPCHSEGGGGRGSSRGRRWRGGDALFGASTDGRQPRAVEPYDVVDVSAFAEHDGSIVDLTSTGTVKAPDSDKKC